MDLGSKERVKTVMCRSCALVHRHPTARGAPGTPACWSTGVAALENAVLALKEYASNPHTVTGSESVGGLVPVAAHAFDFSGDADVHGIVRIEVWRYAPVASRVRLLFHWRSQFRRRSTAASASNARARFASRASTYIARAHIEPNI